MANSAEGSTGGGHRQTDIGASSAVDDNAARPSRHASPVGASSSGVSSSAAAATITTSSSPAAAAATAAAGASSSAAGGSLSGGGATRNPPPLHLGSLSSLTPPPSFSSTNASTGQPQRQPSLEPETPLSPGPFDGHPPPPSDAAIEQIIASAMALASSSRGGGGGGGHASAFAGGEGLVGGMGHHQAYHAASIARNSTPSTSFGATGGPGGSAASAPLLHSGPLAPPPPPPSTSPLPPQSHAVIGAGVFNYPPNRAAQVLGFHPAAVGVDGRVNLFVGNLPYRVRWQDVKDLFRRAGTVLRADVALDPQTNRSRGHGSVLMGSREDGIKAIEMFNGYNWQTRILEVRPDRLPPEYEPHPYMPQQQQQQQQGQHHHHHAPQHPSHFGPSAPFGSSYGSAVGGNGFDPMSHVAQQQPHHMPFMAAAAVQYQQMMLLQAQAHQQRRPSSGAAGGGTVDPRAVHFDAGSRVAPNTIDNAGSTPSKDPWAGGGLAISPAATHASPQLRRPSAAGDSGAGHRSVSPIGTASHITGGVQAQQHIADMSPFASFSAPTSSGGPVDRRVSTSSSPRLEAQQRAAAAVASAASQRRDSAASSPFQAASPANIPGLPRGSVDSLARDVADSRRDSVISASGAATQAGQAPGGFEQYTQPKSSYHDPIGGRLLHVGNLPFQTQWQDLKDLFRPFGVVVRADIATGPDGRSKGHGTVLFSVESDAALAVARLDGLEYQGRQLKVRQDWQNGVSSRPFPPANHVVSSGGSYPAPMSGGMSSFSIFGAPPGAPAPSELYPPTNMYPSRLAGHEAAASADPSSSGSAAQPPPPSGDSNGAPAPGSRASTLRNGHQRPGRIALPAFPTFGQAPGPSAMSPLQTRGLPPMTPSMPGFTFHAYPSTPPLHPMSFLSPGIGPYSPTLGSPPAFGNFNPFMNAAPGAPMQMTPTAARPMPSEPEYFPQVKAENEGHVGSESNDVKALRERVEGLVLPKQGGADVPLQAVGTPTTATRASFTMATRPDLTVLERDRRASMNDAAAAAAASSLSEE